MPFCQVSEPFSSEAPFPEEIAAMKVSARCLLLVLPFSPTAFSLVQKAGLQVPASAAASKQQVVQMFTEAYGAYKTFAFGHDDLAREWFSVSV